MDLCRNVAEQAQEDGGRADAKIRVDAYAIVDDGRPEHEDPRIDVDCDDH